MSGSDTYSGAQHKPLGGYAVLTLTFTSLVAAFALLRARSGRPLPERIPARDIALLGVGTFKLSRLVTKERVTSFMRAPFTRYEGTGRPAEVEEKPRGRGLRRAVGELLVCPYCIGQWIGTALLGAYLWRPRHVRTVASLLAVVTAADYLQQAWAAVDKRA